MDFDKLIHSTVMIVIEKIKVEGEDRIQELQNIIESKVQEFKDELEESIKTLRNIIKHEYYQQINMQIDRVEDLNLKTFQYYDTKLQKLLPLNNISVEDSMEELEEIIDKLEYLKYELKAEQKSRQLLLS